MMVCWLTLQILAASPVVNTVFIRHPALPAQPARMKEVRARGGMTEPGQLDRDPSLNRCYRFPGTHLGTVPKFVTGSRKGVFCVGERGDGKDGEYRPSLSSS